MQMLPLTVDGDRFRDTNGREVMLRGINLGGDCKLPFENGETWRNDDFSGHRDVSFVGRPFPLEEAHIHFERLRGWGFNCLRLLTTWEAVEHAGRGVYDTAYLNYYAELCRMAGDHGFYVFVDFHQDVWSRMTGGSGAPGWTLETIGIHIQSMERAGAALTMQRSFNANDPNPHQATYPVMCWSSNYGLAANGIMWSLFFGGRHILPDFRIDGEHVQDILQGSYLKAMAEVAKRVAHLPNVIGFDSLNEPSVGWLDSPLSQPLRRYKRPGTAISPLAGLASASGHAVEIPVFGFGSDEPVGATTLNPDRLRIWRDDVQCPFEQAGIYSVVDGEPVALKESAFELSRTGERLDVPNEIYGEFFRAVARTIREIKPSWLLFAELEPTGPFRGHVYPEQMPTGSVNACHWYDLSTLVFKRLDVDNYLNLLTGQTASGEAAVTANYQAGLAFRKAEAARFGGAPTLIGEFGIPFDLDQGFAYAAWAKGDREGVFAVHETALGMMYDALDALSLSATLWNYTASNRNDLRIGDGWNQEDLSVYSVDQVDGPDAGGRAVKGFARPYIRAAQGTIVSAAFDRTTQVFTAVVEVDPEISGHTEIALPTAHFGEQPKIECDPKPVKIETGNGVASLLFDTPTRVTLRCHPS